MARLTAGKEPTLGLLATQRGEDEEGQPAPGGGKASSKSPSGQVGGHGDPIPIVPRYVILPLKFPYERLIVPLGRAGKSRERSASRLVRT
jgi:hypothetical protein